MHFIQLESFRNLPAEAGPDDFWFVSTVRMPAWVDEPGSAAPYRPFAAILLSRKFGLHASELVESRARAQELIFTTLLQFALKPEVHCRPACIATDRPEIKQLLTDSLGDLAEVQTVADFPPLAAVKRDMANFHGGTVIPGALAGKGVNIHHLRAFAQAAADFYRAAPWRFLTDYDLIAIDAPRTTAGQKYFVVMGAAGQTFGLAFYKSLRRYELTMSGTGDGSEMLIDSSPLFSVMFEPAHHMPFEDHDIWEEHSLPLAGPQAYPFAAFFDPAKDTITRPDAALLNHVTAIFAAMASATEADLDSGRFNKEVVTPGAQNALYQLSLPSLLKFKIPEHADSLDLIEMALDTGGRRQLLLARRAVELDPDDADAYIILARREHDPQRRIQLAQDAVDAGRRAIGDSYDQFAGHFWLALGTRPYMRARLELAIALRLAKRHEEGLAQFMELLRLNPNDNQGVRDLVPAALFDLNRPAEVLEFTRKWGHDMALPAYAAALAAFRLEGDSPQARQLLKQAQAMNPYVPRAIVRGEEFGDQGESTYSPGEPSEAAFCSVELGPSWRETPGAIAWLKSAIKTPPPPPRSTRRRRK